MTTNKHPDDCHRCGAHVAARAGKRIPHGDAWVTVHKDCGQAEPGGTPMWAVPAYGRTAAGNEATGVVIAWGDRPQPDAVPMNDAARAWREGN